MTTESAKLKTILIPSIDRALRSRRISKTSKIYGRSIVTNILREIMEGLRTQILLGEPIVRNITLDAIALELVTRLQTIFSLGPKPVLNLTGTVLHTSLGRASLPSEAIDAMISVANGASNLEYALATGKRGHRDDHLVDLICRLTGAEAACAVNNNAAAVMLVLNTFACNKEVLISRGELVEIGGSFRMPDIMSVAGTLLREVGTTNRTHLQDFENAFNENTALVMKVHTSNYQVNGFTKSVSEKMLANFANRYDVPIVVDLGSGSLTDLSVYHLPKEPTVRETLQTGVDIVTFSGDKLLGGPQAGFIVGRKDLIAKINTNPMKRAMRLDKIRIAGLRAVLQLYLNPEKLKVRLPTLRMLTRSHKEIARMVKGIQKEMTDALVGIASVKILNCNSQIGSGALPVDLLPSAGFSLTPENKRGKRKDLKSRALINLAASFRSLPTPIIGKLSNGALILDLRCLEDPSSLTSQLPELRQRLLNET